MEKQKDLIQRMQKYIAQSLSEHMIRPYMPDDETNEIGLQNAIRRGHEEHIESLMEILKQNGIPFT